LIIVRSTKGCSQQPSNNCSVSSIRYDTIRQKRLTWTQKLSIQL